MCNINWKEILSEDPNGILKTLNTVCCKICKENIPTRSSTGGKRRSKIEKYRRTLTKRRRKITKKLILSNSQTRKAKIKEELIQIEKKLHKFLRTKNNLLKTKLLHL